MNGPTVPASYIYAVYGEDGVYAVRDAHENRWSLFSMPMIPRLQWYGVATPFSSMKVER